jgi:2-dehydro-3-deoxygluconokinase
MSKIVTFGEIMLRLQPEGFKRFVQAEKFEAVFGGAEANVAASLAQWGHEAVFLSKLPQNAIADACVGKLRGVGVNTSFIVRGGARMGIYFAEKGASQRASKVIYDRAGAAITTIKPEEIDWEVLFDGVKWFHFTGITAALSEDALKTLEFAVAEAKRRGITVSCDLNYRKNLWTRERAKEVMSELTKSVDVIISNEEDCKDVFGLTADGTDIEGGKLNVLGYKGLAKKLFSQFPGLKQVAFTLRESVSASINGWSAVLCGKDGGFFEAPKYNINIVDRIGGGDSFGAGLIHSLVSGADGQTAVNFAVAASCLKHSIEGDFNYVSLDEVNALAKGNASGRVQR